MRLTPMAKMEQLPAPSTARNFHLADLVSLPDHTAKTQYQKFETNIPIKGTARQQSQFLHHVSVSDLYIRTIGLSILLQANRWTKRGNIKIARRLFRFLGIHKSKFLCSACSKVKQVIN